MRATLCRSAPDTPSCALRRTARCVVARRIVSAAQGLGSLDNDLTRIASPRKLPMKQSNDAAHQVRTADVGAPRCGAFSRLCPGTSAQKF